MRRYVLEYLLLAVVLVVVGASNASAVTLTHTLSIYADRVSVPLKEPRGVTCSDDSTVIVADTGNHRLVRYRVGDGRLEGGEVIKVGQLWNPVRVKLNSKGEIFVLDGKQRRLIRLSATGTFRGYVDVESSSSAALGGGTLSFDIDAKDNLYVLGTGSAGVHILDSAGRPVRSIALPRDSEMITDLAVDTAGTVFLLDAVRAQVYSVSPGGGSATALTQGMRDWISFPTAIATDSRGLLYLVDRNGGSIVLLALDDGSFQGRGLGYGWNEGMLRYPSDFCANTRGEAFVADTANNRVQVVAVVR